MMVLIKLEAFQLMEALAQVSLFADLLSNIMENTLFTMKEDLISLQDQFLDITDSRLEEKMESSRSTIDDKQKSILPSNYLLINQLQTILMNK